jgi:hypothetical protein
MATATVTPRTTTAIGATGKSDHARRLLREGARGDADVAPSTAGGTGDARGDAGGLGERVLSIGPS